MKKETLWILIRLQIIYEITRQFNREVSLVKHFNRTSPDSAPSRLGVLKEKRQAIINAVDFYKKLPIPEGPLDTFGVKQGSADQYLFGVMGSRGIQKHLFNLISAAAHFGFIKDEDVFKFYSDSKQIATILSSGKIDPAEGVTGIMFIAFLNELFDHALMPTAEEFMQIDIASTIDVFMKHVGVV